MSGADAMRRRAVRLAVSSLGLLGAASAAVAQPDSETERVKCEAVASVWAPVRMPEAGINAAIPCNDEQLAAYKNSNEARKAASGLAGCERDGRTFSVLYLINTPAGFFDNAVTNWKRSPVQNFEVGGHRVFRAAAVGKGETYGQQLIEIDPARAVLMWTSSKVPKDADFSTMTSCFFNSFRVVKS